MYEYAHPRPPPSAQMFPMDHKGTKEGTELYLEFFRSGVAAETEETITRRVVSSVLIVWGGSWGMRLPLLHLPPRGAGTGIHFRSD